MYTAQVESRKIGPIYIYEPCVYSYTQRSRDSTTTIIMIFIRNFPRKDCAWKLSEKLFEGNSAHVRTAVEYKPESRAGLPQPSRFRPDFS